MLSVAQRGLHQMVKECTGDNSCLDLVLTSDVFMVLNLNVVTPFSNSDHCMVEFELLLDQTGSKPVTTATESYYDYGNADIQSMDWFLFFGIIHSIVKSG